MSKKYLLRLTAVAALAAGGLAIPATAAQATLGSCGDGYTASSYWVHCTGSAPTQYRAKLICWQIVGSGSQTKYGAWVTAGSTPNSEAVCSSGYESGQGSKEVH